MKLYSEISKKVKKQFRKLPSDAQRLYVEKCKLLRATSVQHPSFEWEKVKGLRKGSEPYYRVSVTKDWRAICIYSEEDDLLYWYWIGPHHEYDRVIENLK